MHQGFTRNDAACNPELQFANLIWLISVLMFTVPSKELCYDAAHTNETFPMVFIVRQKGKINKEEQSERRVMGDGLYSCNTSSVSYVNDFCIMTAAERFLTQATGGH